MKIHAIQTGRVQIKQAQIEARGHGLWRRAQPFLSGEWADWSPTYAWAIEHPEGVIVVDTGEAAHLKSLPRWHPYFRLAVRFDIEPEQEVGAQLRGLGIDARDVKLVVLTHMHIDHDGGLAHFRHSRIFASGGELSRASGVRGSLLGYLPSRWPTWFDPEPMDWQPSAYGPFTHSARLSAAGDVIAVRTPGHTPSHLSVIVNDGDTLIVLAGDASYLEATMVSGTVDGISPDESVAKATLARIRRLCAGHPTVYLPTHDPKSGERLANRQVTSIRD
ncbi:MAG TPA: N-acyl homoserine lactonase family protein [Xanthobacteraceae bacterium]|nr:N-acyl homoserine lactonase family protein [Xanthobacteraceae bacterium]